VHRTAPIETCGNASCLVPEGMKLNKPEQYVQYLYTRNYRVRLAIFPVITQESVREPRHTSRSCELFLDAAINTTKRALLDPYKDTKSAAAQCKSTAVVRCCLSGVQCQQTIRSHLRSPSSHSTPDRCVRNRQRRSNLSWGKSRG
jgi:hypothetical protein